MGACDFMTRASGDTPAEAFRKAVADAKHEHGHRGYTGTIAEKHSFRMVTPRPGETPYDCANRLLDADEFDKYGDAGCINVEDGVYLFFGWASS